MWTNENLKTVVEALDEMIPAMGSVKNINKNRCLERFRTAQNVVHDIFNNGLGNRGKQLKVLKLKMWELPLEQYRGGELLMRANWDRVKEIVEPRMEKVILDAAKEQGIKLELVPNTLTGELELTAV
tara:strand:- start:1386 stop:1766 length:381 start_codon:yes stop_codon:yes gene_type:complete